MSTRRDFLHGTAAAGGGLIVAIQLPGCTDRPDGVAPANPAAPVQPNAWLRIETDGSVVFLSDRSEMGQGVYTALPTLLAEELEVPVETVRVEAAPPGTAYVNDLLGGQVTGGSTSVRDAFEKLRRAGAEARMRLVAAAAAHWDVDAATLIARDGMVIGPGGETLSYGQLAGGAAQLAPPDEVPLKPASEFSQIGRTRPRLDTAAKVDGSATFGIDVRLPDMLYGALAMSPTLGGSVASFDATRAREMPGVREIVSTANGIVVVADSWWEARTARDALEIDWDAGPRAGLDNATIEQALADALDTRSAEALVPRNDGDADAAIAGSDRLVEAVYQLPMLAHATLEPQNCTAQRVGDRVHVHAPTQVQQAAQAAAAAAAGIAPEDVVVHTTYLGGGFGRRLEVDFIADAVQAALAVDRPVKLLWTREDDTTHDYYRPPVRHRCSAAFDAAGELTAWKLEICAPSGLARWAPEVLEQLVIDPFSIEAAANYPYDVPNVRVTYLQHEVGLDVGFWRSVSHATNCFTCESFMDELAHAAQADPFEFRSRLLAQQQESRWARVLERAAERAGWGRAEAGRYQGIALMEGYGSYLAMVAEITMPDEKVRVEKITCVVDCGQMVNPSIVEAQIQSGIVFGLSAALWGEVSVTGGRVQQENFDSVRLLAINEMPEIDVDLYSSDAAPGGVGEPSTALVAPALGNAIFAATGRRIRSLPISRHGLV